MARRLRVGPRLDEQVAFHASCCTAPVRRYGVIGGDVCMISAKRGALHLRFVDGASLPERRRA